METNVCIVATLSIVHEKFVCFLSLSLKRAGNKKKTILNYI